MKDNKDRMKELISILREASRTYYDEDCEIISNLEYDELYDELQALESKTGLVFSNSPSLHVGYSVASDLPQEDHAYPMLSLDKTKSPEELQDWLKEHRGIMSLKLDGLTVVLTYRDGSLYKALTRGDGITGEVITANAKTFVNLPGLIPYKGELTVRGEAIIKYSDFEKINSKVMDVELKYKNPRNLCSGSVRQLDPKVTAQRNVSFYAFSLVEVNDVDFKDSRFEEMEFLEKLGFDVVEHRLLYAKDIVGSVSAFTHQVEGSDLPTDGLVLSYDSISYSLSLGATSKFPRDSIAFKWADELVETKLIDIEWSTSRTGLINPIAIFEPVEIEGTTVSRASVHNISILESLELGIGDRIRVFKANMIIPQLEENLTRSGPMEIPRECPVCGGKALIKDENGVRFLYCSNEDCSARKLKNFAHFASRKAMNIDGLSEATLEKFIAKGFIKEYADIFKLADHKDEIVDMEGFGQKSYNRLIVAIEKARHTKTGRLLYGLGIPNIGQANSRLIARHYRNDWGKIAEATAEDLVEIEGIGDIMARAYVNFFAQDYNKEVVANLLEEIELTDKGESKEAEDLPLEGKAFVITGSLRHFENRDSLKEKILSLGGQAPTSVSAKTDFLINNDPASSSSKNKRAKDLGIKIISEEEFLNLIDKGE